MASPDLDLHNANHVMGQAMSEGGSPAFVRLESRVGHLEGALLDIKGMVQKLVDRPVNPGLTQVLGTLATTLVVIGFVFGFARYNLIKAVQPLRDDVATINRKVEKMDDDQRVSAIRIAVLEERANWIRSMSSWEAKTDRPR